MPGVAHPTIVSESGRALVGYYSVLLVNVLSTASFEVPELPEPVSGPVPEPVRNLLEVAVGLRTRNLREFYNDAIYYREEIQKAFKHGDITLRQHAQADRLFWHILTKIRAEIPKLRFVPDDMRGWKTPWPTSTTATSASSSPCPTAGPSTSSSRSCPSSA
jgi:arginine decarboxylase